MSFVIYGIPITVSCSSWVERVNFAIACYLKSLSLGSPALVPLAFQEGWPFCKRKDL